MNKPRERIENAVRDILTSIHKLAGIQIELTKEEDTKIAKIVTNAIKNALIAIHQNNKPFTLSDEKEK